MSAPASKVAGAAALAVPEVAVPLAIAKGLVEARRSRQTATQTVQLESGAKMIQLPPEPLIVIRKAQIRSIKRGGERIIVATPARGLKAGEAIAIGILAAATGGSYLAWRALGSPTSIQGFESSIVPQGPHSTVSWPQSINPLTWRL